MPHPDIHVVTGAFGYSGGYIARRLLAAGHAVRTLTNSPHRESPLAQHVQAMPYRFDAPAALADALRGARVLYNTYWVRFNRAGFRQNVAVENTLRLFDAAQSAGVERVVHVSITNPAEDSDLPYFAGKARLEGALRESGLAHAILRPTVLFGREDILINNIAWVLRKFPVFGLFGDGTYRLQPIYVDDLAALAAEQGAATGDRVIDAIGPETFTYRELVECIGRAIGRPRPMVSMPPALGLAVARVAGWCVRDVIVTRDEVKGLMRGLLCTASPPAGTTRLSAWAADHADTLGRRYASELARRRDRQRSYSEQ